MPFDRDIYEYTAYFQHGDERGFTYFFNTQYPALLYYAYRIINDKAAAEDILEEAFIKIWERHATFDHPQVIKSWLYTTVRNGCINRLEQLEIIKRHGEIISNEIRNTHERSHLNNIIIAEVIAEVYDSIKVLPKECQKVFKMLYLEDKTVREIAEELNLSISTIKSQKARGLQILRKKFPHLTRIDILDALNLF